MQTYQMSGANANEHTPEHPERTARKNAYGAMNFDVIFGVFPNRPSMLKTIDMQENAGTPNRWKACKR